VLCQVRPFRLIYGERTRNYRLSTMQAKEPGLPPPLAFCIVSGRGSRRERRAVSDRGKP
jgi:hypothetical protein